MQIFMQKSLAQTMSKSRDFIGRENHVIAVQPPLTSFVETNFQTLTCEWVAKN